MKVSVISDLHLEFEPLELPGGEVLIISGDACESRSLAKDFHSTKLVDWTSHSGREYRHQRFFEVECAKYDHVLYVMGNHEHYHGRFDKTYAELRRCLPDHVQLLEQETVTINDTVFIGGTLWTSMNRGDDMTRWHTKSSMNDFRVITNHYVEKNLYHKLTPEYTEFVHRKTLDYFKHVLDHNRDKQCVIITHHAPSSVSIADHYKHDHLMNGAYYSDLSEFILDHPQIKYWTHGHMHNSSDYMIGDCRVICNPRGYFGHETWAGEYDPTVGFEV